MGVYTLRPTTVTGDWTPIGVPGTITVRANPPGYLFYIVGGAIVALILVFGIVRTLRRSRSAGRTRSAALTAPPAPASPAPAADPAPRRMTDDRT